MEGKASRHKNAEKYQVSVRPNLSKVFKWDSYYSRAGSRVPNANDIQELHARATDYLSKFGWCRRILEHYVGFIYPGIVAVFLFKIEPSRASVDDWVWVVVGDLPPAYITCEASPNPATALDSYIGAMEEWVAAAEVGAPTDGLIPVNVPATPENAAMLKSRLQFLDKEILSGYSEDLKEQPDANA